MLQVRPLLVEVDDLSIVKGLLGKQDTVKQIEDSFVAAGAQGSGPVNRSKQQLAEEEIAPGMVKPASSQSIQSMKRSLIG